MWQARSMFQRRDIRVNQSDNHVACGKAILDRPQGSFLQPLPEKTCPTDFRCMNLITVEDVLSVAQTLLKDNRDKDQ